MSVQGVKEYKMILDLPSKNPVLAFDRYAEAFKDIIENSDPQFAIGIFGGWGAGKTTLMQAIEAQLDEDLIIPVRFSAWRYEKEEHLIIPLLDELRESLLAWSERHADAGDSARKTAVTVGKVMRSMLAGLSLKAGVPGVIEATLDANQMLSEAESREDYGKLPQSFYHASFRALSDAFEDFVNDNPNRRIVVFIDDLDRCLPEGALQVLESMKLFFDLKGFVFVVGLDQTVVEWLIDSRYRSTAGLRETSNRRTAGVDREEELSDPTTRGVVLEEEVGSFQVRGADYIKKIFQVPFTLAKVAVGQLPDFLDSVYVEADLPELQQKELQKRVEPHLRYLLTEAGVNPREIKRYINAYILSVKVRPDLGPNTLLALQTLIFRRDWQSVRRALYGYRGIFLNALQRQVTGDDLNALGNLDSQLSGVPQSFLAYVAPGAPGYSLVEDTDRIDDYLFTGASVVEGGPGPALLNAFRDLATAKQVVMDLRSRPGSGDGFRDKLNQLAEPVDRILVLMEDSSTPGIRGPVAPMIKRELRLLKERISYYPTELEPRQAWLEEQGRLLERVQTNLVSLYDLAPLNF